MSRRRIDKDGLIEEFQENRRDEGPQDSPARRSLTASDKNIVEQMFIGLVIEGIADFAPYLARSFAQGYGVKQNEFLSNLTGSIGKKLNNDNTIEKSPIEEIAQECVKQIKANAEIYGSKEIPLKEVLQVVVQFDAQVKKMSAEMVEAPGSSYIESINTVIMRQVAQDSVKKLEFEEKEESSLDDTQNEQRTEQQRLKELEEEQQRQKELAEQQRLKTLEEEQQRQKELAEQQRLKELEEEQQHSLNFLEMIHNQFLLGIELVGYDEY